MVGFAYLFTNLLTYLLTHLLTTYLGPLLLLDARQSRVRTSLLAPYDRSQPRPPSHHRLIPNTTPSLPFDHVDHYDGAQTQHRRLH